MEISLMHAKRINTACENEKTGTENMKDKEKHRDKQRKWERKQSERRQIIVDIQKSQRVWGCSWYVWPLSGCSCSTSKMRCMFTTVSASHKSGRERDRERIGCMNIRRLGAKCDSMRLQSYGLTSTFILIKLIMQTATGMRHLMHLMHYSRNCS